MSVLGVTAPQTRLLIGLAASDDRKRDILEARAKTPSRERVVAPQSTYSAECSSKPASVSNGQIRTRLICVLAMSSISS